MVVTKKKKHNKKEIKAFLVKKGKITRNKVQHI